MAFDINLDREFKDFVSEHGWWIVLRSFNLAKRSKYWNESSKEAIGGPAWEYNDIIFKGRRTEAAGSDPEDYEMRQVLTQEYMVRFYVVSKVRPKKEDQIIEIPHSLRYETKPPRLINAWEIFDIKHVESKIDNNLVYSRVYCTKVTPTNDETLSGPLPVRHIKIR